VDEELKLWAFGLFLFLQYTGRRFLRDRCLEASASLAFATLLALVPVTFIGLAVLRRYFPDRCGRSGLAA
jgi:uncharacterized BrkB/YihY/UPF0761 family membrane protein